MGIKYILRNTTDGHNKQYEVMVYQVQNGLWKVDFAYGKIGYSLLTGTKTNTPVGKYAADKISQKLLEAKEAGGYVLYDQMPWVSLSTFENITGVALPIATKSNKAAPTPDPVPCVIKVIKATKKIRRVRSPIDLSKLLDEEDE